MDVKFLQDLIVSAQTKAAGLLTDRRADGIAEFGERTWQSWRITGEARDADRVGKCVAHHQGWRIVYPRVVALISSHRT